MKKFIVLYIHRCKILFILWEENKYKSAAVIKNIRLLSINCTLFKFLNQFIIEIGIKIETANTIFFCLLLYFLYFF